jgi:hypothetical protein
MVSEPVRESSTTTADDPDGGETAAPVSAKRAEHVPSPSSSSTKEKKAKAARQPRRPFDPFYLIPLFGRDAKDRSIVSLLLPMIVIGAAVLVAATVEGTLGTLSDVSWFTDLQYVFGRSVPYTPPHIPLLRDGPDIALFALIAAGLLLLHRQWKYIGACAPQLRKEGTIVPGERPRTNGLTRALGLNRLIGTSGDYRGFDELERKLLLVGNRFRSFLVAFIVLGGLVLALLLREALDENALRVFVPTDLTPAEQQQWLAQARESWWAGSAHPIGYVLYGLIAWFGMSLIVGYNVMGIITVYVAIAIFLVSKPTADWYNRDGRFGWFAMTLVYRTVYWTIVLFGAVMSVLVALLGSRTPIAVIGLAAMYLLLIPVYTFLPWLVFRRVEADIRASRIRELNDALDGIDKNDLGRTQAFVAEFDRCRNAKIRPMSIGRLRLSGFASVVALPIGLTLLQTLLPLGLGR